MKLYHNYYKWFTLITVALLMICIIGCGGGDDDEATDGGATPAESTKEIPINISDADNVGSLHIELVYDSSVLEVTDVKAGSKIKNGVVEFNTNTSGRLVIGIIDATGISGSGRAVSISFDVVGSGKTDLILENIEATNAETLHDIITEAHKGLYNASDGTTYPPEIEFIQ